MYNQICFTFMFSFQILNIIVNMVEYEKTAISNDGKTLLLFYSGWSFLSNFFVSRFKVDGKRYRSVEQYIQARKSLHVNRLDLNQEIMRLMLHGTSSISVLWMKLWKPNSRSINHWVTPFWRLELNCWSTPAATTLSSAMVWL